MERKKEQARDREKGWFTVGSCFRQVRSKHHSGQRAAGKVWPRTKGGDLKRPRVFYGEIVCRCATAASWDKKLGRFLSLSLLPSLSLFLSLPPSPSLFLSLPPSLSFSFSLPPPLSLSFSRLPISLHYPFFSHSFFTCVSASFPLYHPFLSLSSPPLLSHTHTHTLSLFLSVSLSPSLFLSLLCANKTKNPSQNQNRVEKCVLYLSANTLFYSTDNHMTNDFYSNFWQRETQSIKTWLEMIYMIISVLILERIT